MSSPNIKIVYNGVSGTTTFQPTYPPRHIPSLFQDAVRHDNISTAGIKESVLERVDYFLTVDFEDIPTADNAAWQAFLTYAATGGAFQWFPDATATVFTSYTLEETMTTLSYKSPGLYSTRLKMRQVVS